MPQHVKLQYESRLWGFRMKFMISLLLFVFLIQLTGAAEGKPKENKQKEEHGIKHLFDKVKSYNPFKKKKSYHIKEPADVAGVRGKAGPVKKEQKDEVCLPEYKKPKIKKKGGASSK